jgi:hypothetical protein
MLLNFVAVRVRPLLAFDHRPGMLVACVES